MTDNVIRVQLPGGDSFAPALQLAASKTVERSDLSSRRSTALRDLVEAAVAVLNSGNASMITLEMDLGDDGIEATVTGAGCKSPAKTRVKALTTLADKKARSFEQRKTRADMTIRFGV